MDGNLAGRVQDREQWLRASILGRIELGVEGRILNLGSLRTVVVPSDM